MQQDEETPQSCGVNRREILGFIGATAAVSLVGSVETQSASTEQTSVPSGAKNQAVNVDAKPRAFAMEMARTALIVIDLSHAFPISIPRILWHN